jgi:hypothetical protein
MVRRPSLLQQVEDAPVDRVDFRHCCSCRSLKSRSKQQTIAVQQCLLQQKLCLKIRRVTFIPQHLETCHESCRSGLWRDRRDHRLLPGPRRRRGHGDRPPGPARRWTPASPTPARSRPATPRPGPRPAFPEGAEVDVRQRHAPLSIRPDGSLFQLRWMAQMLRNCSAARYAVNKERMMRLSELQPRLPAQLRADTGIAYEGRSRARCSCSARRQVDAGRARHRGAGGVRRPLRAARRATAVPRRTGAGPGQGPASPAACACQTTKPATASCSPTAGQMAQAWACSSASTPAWTRCCSTGRGPPSPACNWPGGGKWCTRRPLRAGPGQLLARSCWSRWAWRLPVYPVKGYSLTVPDARRGAGTRCRRSWTRPTRSR